jgi:peroxiredoxin (alkyl hydroperoxide reductase subunit C)
MVHFSHHAFSLEGDMTKILGVDTTTQKPLPVGASAPDFSLPGTTETPIRLSDYRGRKNVVLAFYPFDFSPVCSLQLPGLQERLPEFHKLDAEVLGISVDSKYSHRAFAQQLGLTFPLLSDFNREVSRAYGVLRESGSSERALFVVDKEGIIRYSYVSEMGQAPDNEPVLEVLRQVQNEQLSATA